MLLRRRLASDRVSLHFIRRGEESSGKGRTDGVKDLIEECTIFCDLDSFPFALLPLKVFRIRSWGDSASFDPVLPL